MPAKNPKLDDAIDAAYEALYDDKLPEAKKLLDDARRLGGGAPEVRLLEIDLLAAEDLGEEAISAAEEALEKHKTDMVLRFRLATLLLDVYDDVGEARPHLEDIARRLQKGDKPDVGGDDVEAQKEAVDDFHLEVLLTLADARAADHDPNGSLAAADLAVSVAADDAMARVTRAAALFDLCRLDDADKAVAQAIDRDSRCADAFWLRGRILTVRGDEEGAAKALARAVTLDEERFQAPFRVDEDTFAKLMEDSLGDLPKKVRDYLKNVAVVVADVPDVDKLKKSDPPLSPGSLGLYEGTPPSLAGSDPWAQFPNHITLFRKNIELASTTADELKDMVGTTLLHEVGHYLGLDEDDLDARGLG